METSTSILLEQKRAELKVKLTILKENISNIKNQLESMTDINEISSKAIKTRDIISLREYQSSALSSELTKEKQTLEGLKMYLANLENEREEASSESEFYKKKISEIKNKISNLQKIYEESHNKKLLLQQEVQSLQNENSSYNKQKFDNDKLHATSMNQQEFMTDSISKNKKKIQIMQMKIDSLNKQLVQSEDKLKEVNTAIEDDSFYNKNIQNHIGVLEANIKSFDDKIFLIRREIDETKDYINSSHNEKDKLSKQLEKMKGILEKINAKNIKINANLQIILKSFEKKKLFMEKEQEFYDNCIVARKKLIDELKEIDSYKDLI